MNRGQGEHLYIISAGFLDDGGLEMFASFEVELVNAALPDMKQPQSGQSAGEYEQHISALGGVAKGNSADWRWSTRGYTSVSRPLTERVVEQVWVFQLERLTGRSRVKPEASSDVGRYAIQH